MSKVNRTLAALLVALAILILAAVTSHRWDTGRHEEDLGRGVVAVLAFISLFIVLSSAVVLCTFISTVAWAQARAAGRTRSDAIVTLLGIGSSVFAFWYVAFFFGMSP